MQKDPGEVAVLRVPPDASRPRHTLDREDLRAAFPKGVDEGLGPPGVPVELHGRAIQVAMVEEELQAAERCLPAPSREGDEVSRAEEPVAVDCAEDVEVTRREDDAAHWSAVETWSAGLSLGHWESA